MPNAAAPRKSSPRRKAVIIGFSIVIAIIVVIGVANLWQRSRSPLTRGFFGLVPALQATTDKTAQGLMDGGAVAMKFVSDIRTEHWRDAFQSTSLRFQQQMGQAKFERFIKDGPPLRSPETPVKFDLMVASQGASVTFSGMGVAPDGGIWLLLVGEGGTLKVDRLAVGQHSAP